MHGPAAARGTTPAGCPASRRWCPPSRRVRRHASGSDPGLPERRPPGARRQPARFLAPGTSPISKAAGSARLRPEHRPFQRRCGAGVFLGAGWRAACGRLARQKRREVARATFRCATAEPNIVRFNRASQRRGRGNDRTVQLPYDVDVVHGHEKGDVRILLRALRPAGKRQRTLRRRDRNESSSRACSAGHRTVGVARRGTPGGESAGFSQSAGRQSGSSRRRGGAMAGQGRRADRPSALGDIRCGRNRATPMGARSKGLSTPCPRRLWIEGDRHHGQGVDNPASGVPQFRRGRLWCRQRAVFWSVAAAAGQPLLQGRRGLGADAVSRPVPRARRSAC